MMARVVSGRVIPLGAIAVPRARLAAVAVARVALARGVRRGRLGQLAPTDPAAWSALAAQLDPQSAFGQEVASCAANPTAACQAAAPDWFTTVYMSPAQRTAIDAAIASGSAIPYEPGQVGVPGVVAPVAGPTSGVLGPQPGAAAGPAAPSGPRPTVAFSTSSGNTSSPAVGDRWTISIAGSPGWAGQPVTVYGSVAPSSGVRQESAEGRLDASGNYSTSGQFTPDEVGAWYEDWKVGGQVIGNWSFTVTPANTGPTAGPAPAASSSSASGAGAPAGGQVAAPAGAVSVFSLIPWWLWLGGGGLALYAFSGGGRR